MTTAAHEGSVNMRGLCGAESRYVDGLVASCAPLGGAILALYLGFPLKSELIRKSAFLTESCRDALVCVRLSPNFARSAWSGLSSRLCLLSLGEDSAKKASVRTASDECEEKPKTESSDLARTC